MPIHRTIRADTRVRRGLSRIVLAVLVMVWTAVTTQSAFASCGGTLCPGSADPCNQGTACSLIGGWENEFRSVVKLTAYSVYYGVYSHATGVLVNNVNSDGTPYVVTVAHAFDF